METPDMTDLAKAPPLPRCRGAIDHIELGDRVELSGWILHPRHDFDEVSISVGSLFVARCRLTQRPDVDEVFPHLSPRPTGFAAHVAMRPGVEVEAEGAIEIVAFQNGGAAGRFVSRMLDAPSSPSLPPAELRQRVAGSDDERSFALQEVELTEDILEVMQEFGICDDASVRMMDWGCGPGRITRRLAARMPSTQIFACDIDASAIAWCKAAIANVQFKACQPYPPLPYPDSFFDVLIGCSVMTHLKIDDQIIWLREIRRVVRPGGLALLSVHGVFAASFYGLADIVQRDGYHDAIHDKTMDGIAPAGYYRATFQEFAETKRIWESQGEVVAYREAAVGGFQDLVVLRFNVGGGNELQYDAVGQATQ